MGVQRVENDVRREVHGILRGREQIDVPPGSDVLKEMRGGWVVHRRARVSER